MVRLQWPLKNMYIFNNTIIVLNKSQPIIENNVRKSCSSLNLVLGFDYLGQTFNVELNYTTYSKLILMI